MKKGLPIFDRFLDNRAKGPRRFSRQTGPAVSAIRRANGQALFSFCDMDAGEGDSPSRTCHNFRDMLVLASASPRRRALLTAAGIDFEVLPVDVDETPLDGEAPEAHVQRLAREKAQAALVQRRRPWCWARTRSSSSAARSSESRGTPRTRPACCGRSSGRAHEVLTGVALASTRAQRGRARADAGLVRRRSPTRKSPTTSRAASRCDKAGAYAIQGLASKFVDRIDGSYSNVVGLPVALVYRLLKGYPEA